MTEKEKRHKQMSVLYDELLAFTHSPLYTYRSIHNYSPVIGEGSYTAAIMFIGEAPGKTEAETGQPFCGRSGKVLDEMISSIGLLRSEVYITSIVKDRPPENRDPTPQEIAAYAPFLDRQIEIIKPRVIATLGRFSMLYIMERLGLKEQCGSIGEMHGKVVLAEASYGSVYVVPLYHPAVALYKSSNKRTLLTDFQALKQFVI